jgi:hypothetical protein
MFTRYGIMRPLDFSGLSLVSFTSHNITIFRRKQMNRLRQFCIVVVLTFALNFSAFAGEMATGVVQPPPPPPPQAASVMGEMATGVTATDEESAETSVVDPVTAFTLDILQSLLSLF